MSGRDRYIIASEIIGYLKHSWETGQSLDGIQGPLYHLVKRYDEAPKPSFEVIGMLCQCEYCRGVRAGELPPRFDQEKRAKWFEEHGITEEEWKEQQRQKEEEEREQRLTPNPT